MDVHELILNIYYFDDVMRVKFLGVSSVIAELLPFDCQKFNDFFRPHPYLDNQWIEFHETYSEYI